MSAVAERKRRPEPSAETKPQPDEWISAAEAAAIIHRTPRAVQRLALGGHVRFHRPPGLLPRYLKADVLMFAPGAAPPA